MATIYFSNSDPSGVGSMREALAQAQDGDCVTPDPNVFPHGETIVVTLNSPVTITSSLTLDAGAYRLRITSASNSYLLRTSGNIASLTLVGLDLLGRVLVEVTELTLERCFLAPNINSSSALSNTCTLDGCQTTLRSCVVTGAALKGVSATNINLYSSTIVGNRSKTSYANAVNSLVDVTPSTAGFLAPPPDDLSTLSGVLPWQNWNFRLAEDSPYRTGANLEAQTRYDLDGMPRRRAQDSYADAALGAYEYQPYDAYWIGRDALGQTVATPRFNAPEGWATSPNAQASNLVEPPQGRVLVLESAQFNDAPTNLQSVDLLGAKNVLCADETADASVQLRLGVGAQWRGVACAPSRAELARYAVATLPGHSLTTLNLHQNARCVLTSNALVESLVAEENATLQLQGVDRVLCIQSVSAQNLTVSLADDDSSGFLSLYNDEQRAAFQLVDVDYAQFVAPVTQFTAEASQIDSVWLRWTSTSTQLNSLLQLRQDGQWRQLTAQPTCEWDEENQLAHYRLQLDMPKGRVQFRLFDGLNLFYDDAWTVRGVQFKALAIAVPAAQPQTHWEVITQLATTSTTVMVGQAVTILARLYDAFNQEDCLLNTGDNIVSVRYTCYRNVNGVFGDLLEPVEGHDDVEVDTDAILEAIQTSDAWTADETGYNFVLTPDTREHDLFDKKGEYQIKATVALRQGNPIVFYVPISVEDRSNY